jgi:N-acetylglucosamine kinase-like BadF-type ATPase
MGRVFVGLDCGGSSTRLLAVSCAGDILASAQSGSANLVSTPEKRLLKNLTAVAEECPPANFVCGGFAGLVGEEDRQRALGYLSAVFPGAKVRAEPDYFAAFAASEAGTEVCVIAGTGSLVCSLYDGQIVKSGGRGYLLGDEGSAFQYGRDALTAYLDDPASVGPLVVETIERSFRTREPRAVISHVYRGGSPQAPIARLAKGLVQDAKEGRPYALASIEKNARALANVLVRHVAKYGIGKEDGVVRVSLAGGLWQGTGLIRDAFAAGLAELDPDRKYALTRIQRAPVQGAVELAREMADGN